MADMYSTNEKSKKKFLAPLVVLLLCMVALTGAGYAYTSTIDNNGNSGDLDGLTMELDGTFQANGSMFAITGLDIATHTTNGFALWYGEKIGFVNATTCKVYGSEQGQVPSIDGFGTGYYVQTIYNDDADTAYHAAAERENIDFTADAAALADIGVYKVGDNFTLNINNATDSDVTLKGDITGFDGKIDGIADVYIVIKNGNAVVGSISLSDGAGLVTIGNIDEGDVVSYTVQAYVAITDYYASTLPTVPADAYTFDVSFAAETA